MPCPHLHKDCIKIIPAFSKLWCWKFRCSGNIISSSLNHLLRRCCLDSLLSCCEESICASQFSLKIPVVQPAYTHFVLYLFDLSRLYWSPILLLPNHLAAISSVWSTPHFFVLCLRSAQGAVCNEFPGGKFQGLVVEVFWWWWSFSGRCRFWVLASLLIFCSRVLCWLIWYCGSLQKWVTYDDALGFRWKQG